jgi:UDP-N-acetyl-2-amino-2-deoxyglucuronate dehydrogenase
MNHSAITERKIKAAIVGCGRIAKNHFLALDDHSNNIELVAVCDVEPDIAQAHGEQYHVSYFTDLDTLLNEVACDLIILTTPSGMHPQQACAAAKKGKHVLTEKPMATTWHDGVNMVSVCEQNNVQLFVVKQNRLNPTVQALKQAIDAGRFGKIYTIHANVFWTRPQAYYDQAAWRGTWELDGGALMNQASHYVDLLEWLGGSIESVQAMTATLARKIEAEDSAVLNIRWRNGALGSMCVSMLTYPKNLEGSITVLGEKGTVRLDGVALNEIKHWEFEDDGPSKQDVEQLGYSTTSVYGNGHGLYYENVIATLRGEARPATDGHSGLKSLELLIAAYLSAREGKTVHLPLEI